LFIFLLLYIFVFFNQLHTKELAMDKERKCSFGDNVKEPIIERIFSLVERYPSRNEAAKAWGININTLQNYYKRRDIAPTPRKQLLEVIANHEGVSLDWLVEGIGEPPVNTKKEHNKEHAHSGLMIQTPDSRHCFRFCLTRKTITV
jgi:hypothetical protein